MAKRLTTRVSAGASLVLGLGFAGAALATPAQADPVSVTQQYECTYDVLNVGQVGGDPAVTVTLEADVPSTAQVGDEVATDVTATVTIPDSRRDSLYGLLGVRQIDGPNATEAAADANNSKDARNQAEVTLEDGGTGNIPLSFPKTDVPASGELTVDASGAVGPITLDQAGSFTISAGDFQAYIRGYDADGGYKTNITMDCTNVSEDKTFATVEVTEATDPTDDDPTTDDPTTDDPTTDDPSSTPTPTAEVNDWFQEPSSLPISQDRNSFTVEGTASQAGTLLVQLLDGNKKVLKTYTWDVSEGSNKRNFDFVEGTDYARVISQDCVDAEGNDESVVDSGCNVEYYAPWADIKDDEGDDDGDNGDDGSSPETPGTVQTDALQRVSSTESNGSAALALGGLLLAGAAAGSVVVARRRAAAQH